MYQELVDQLVRMETISVVLVGIAIIFLGIGVIFITKTISAFCKDEKALVPGLFATFFIVIFITLVAITSSPLLSSKYVVLRFFSNKMDQVIEKNPESIADFTKLIERMDEYLK